jgi:hypothetical protein
MKRDIIRGIGERMIIVGTHLPLHVQHPFTPMAMQPIVRDISGIKVCTTMSCYLLRNG